MLGPAKPRDLDRPVIVSLERLVPPDHFYRHLDAALDLSFVRSWVAECYADRGRPSIDPVVFFRFHLIMFFEGIRSERQLVEHASLNLAHRWYLGYHLDEPLPDRSSLVRSGSVSGWRSFGASSSTSSICVGCRTDLGQGGAGGRHPCTRECIDGFTRATAENGRRRPPGRSLRYQIVRGAAKRNDADDRKSAGTCWRGVGSIPSGRRLVRISASVTAR